LDAKQKEAVDRIMKDAIAQMRELFQATREGVSEGQERAAKLRDQAYEQCLALLSPDQRKTWEAIQGQPFEFKKVVTAKPPVNAKGGNTEFVLAKPAADPKDLAWVAETADAWLPLPEERKMDLIGWADGLIPALRLAREHQRPVFIFTLDGVLSQGRC
jgi:hypothetical protein